LEAQQDLGSKSRIPKFSLFIMDFTGLGGFSQKLHLGAQRSPELAKARMIKIEKLRQTE
jgi:hypothetical protein